MLSPAGYLRNYEISLAISLPQIGLADIFIFQQVAAFPFQDYDSGLHHVPVICKFKAVFGVLAQSKDSASFAVDLSQPPL